MDWKVVLPSFISTLGALSLNEAIAQTTLQSQTSTDPNRGPETMWCSSVKLGNAQSCLSSIQRLGAQNYSLSLNQSCTGREYGIDLSVKDVSGRCLRNVIFLKPTAKTGYIQSAVPPRVIDAVPIRDVAAKACYYRRHERVSCDGKSSMR
jgi:hypothetical protein